MSLLFIESVGRAEIGSSSPLCAGGVAARCTRPITKRFSSLVMLCQLCQLCQNAHGGAPASEALARSRRVPCAKTVPESEVFMPLGLALSEKRIPQLTENTEKSK